MDQAEQKLRNLTRNQAIAVLAGCGTGFVVNIVAGRLLLKHVEGIEEKNKHLMKAVKELTRIAEYESKLIQKHVDGRHVDEFDQLVMDDLANDLVDTLAEIRRWYPEALDPEAEGADDPEAPENP